MRRVIVGTAGGEFGVRGWVKGLDLATGRIVWTGYNTGPDDEVLVKPGSFRAFYEKDHQLALTSHLGQPMVGVWDGAGMVLCAALALGGLALGAWGIARRDVQR